MYRKLTPILLLRQVNISTSVMPDLIRHPVFLMDSAPVFTGVTRRNDKFKYLVAGVINLPLIYRE